MREAVLYTGTFDPYHLGHFWQLERVYRAHPFEKAVIAIIESNPKKPHASSWQKRRELMRLMLAGTELPFSVEIHAIRYVEPKYLKQFVAKYLSGYKVIRTVASDVIVEFAEDKQFNFNEALLLFHYAIVVRPLADEQEVNRAIAQLSPEVAKKFSYEIVHVQNEDDISATEIRKSPVAAYDKGYITQSQLDFIRDEHLYE